MQYLKFLLAFASLVVFPATQQPVYSQQIVAENASVSLIKHVRLPAKEAGTLLKLDVREGDKVSKGQTLGEIDTTIAELEIEVARRQEAIARLQKDNEVNLRFAGKSLEVAEAELARLEEAVVSYPRAIPQTELDQAKFVTQRSQMSIEQAMVELESADLTHELRQAERRLADARVIYSLLVAPFDGIVTEIAKQPGEWAQVGEPILRIIWLKKLRIEAFFDHRVCDDSMVGVEANFSLSSGAAPSGLGPSPSDSKVKSREYSGKVVFVSPEINPVNGQVRVWVEVENHDLRLRPGAKGRLELNLPLGSEVGAK